MLCDMSPEDIKRVYDQGVAVANNYKVGDKFLGAWGEAELLGYGPDTMARGIFTVGYCGALHRPIITDRFNVLIQYG